VDRISFLYTGIGRGHPFYLDGIIEAMVRHGKIGLVRNQASVFEISRGLARLGWNLAGWLYQRGSSGGLIGKLYAAIRRRADYNQPGLMLKLMGRDIRREYNDVTGPLVVAHPTLVAVLKGRQKLVYQHGEVVVPEEAVVMGAEKVLAPTDEVAERFKSAGYGDGDVVVTGLCVEPALVSQAEDAYTARRMRLETGPTLTGAFFSSGAEPISHIEKLAACAISLIEAGGRAVVFARKDGRLSRTIRLRSEADGKDAHFVDAGEFIPADIPALLVVEYGSRREENIFTARLFPEFDFFVAPSHERSNWALGLGLPMFIVQPCIGPFAPLNEALLVDAGVAEVVTGDEDCGRFGEHLAQLHRSGEFGKMASAGWGRHKIDGFARIAEFLGNQYNMDSL